MRPASTRVCAWRRRTATNEQKTGVERVGALLVVGGRELATNVPQDLLDVLDYRGRYDSFPNALIAMKLVRASASEPASPATTKPSSSAKPSATASRTAA